MNEKIKSELVTILMLTAVAALFRLFYYNAYLDQVPYALIPLNDARMYWQWGLELYREGWNHPHDQAYYQAPLYSMFIALMHHAGWHSIQNLIGIQLVLGVINTLIFYAMARQFLSYRFAFVTAICFCVCPLVFFFETKSTATTLGLTLWLCFLLSMLKWLDQQKLFFLIPAAVFVSLTVICRPNMLFSLPFVCWCFFVCVPKDQPGLIKISNHTALWFHRHLLVFLAIVLLAIGAVSMRNYMASGEWVLITGNSGVTLYMGNNPQATGGLAVIPGLSNNIEDQVYGGVRLASELAGKELTLNESSRFWMGKTVEFVTSYPLQWLMLEGKKLLWSVFYIPPSVNYSVLFEAEWLGWFYVLFILQVVIFVSGIIAVYHVCRNRNPHNLFLLLTLCGYLLLSLVYYSSARFLTSVVPVLILLAGMMWQDYVEGGHDKRMNRARVILVVWIVLFFVWNPFLRQYQTQDLAMGWYNLGVLAEEKPLLEANAKECYRKALEYNPNHASAMLNLGTLLAKEGDLLQSSEWFEQVLEMEPSNQTALQNLIINYQRLNRRDEIEALKEKYSQSP